MITDESKKKIVEAVKLNAGNYSSAAKMAVALGINPAQMSRIKKGDIENVLSDANWISIARRLAVKLNDSFELIVAKTPVFKFITAQLSNCQTNSISLILADSADIGKTFTATHYARNTKNAIYIDGSQVKTKSKLVRKIAKEFGLNHTGRYADVYEDLVYYIKTIPNPLIIVDEAGDLDYKAFLELKALWNATEYVCGWYMMGADGLKAKIEGNLNRKKVGYAEIFRRYGRRFQRVTPFGQDADKEFAMKQTAVIAKANGISDVRSLFAKTQGSLTRIRIEIKKMKQAS